MTTSDWHPHARGNENPALGRDPFAEEVSIDPYIERLATLRQSEEPERWKRVESDSRPRPDWTERTVKKPPAARRNRARTPTVGDVVIPEPSGWVDRWLGEDVRKRLGALGHMVEGETPYDRFGFSPDVARNAFPWFQALYRHYFRVRSEGHEHLPAEGAAVIAGNHAGLLPFDAAMGVLDVLLHTDPPRLARAIVDRWAGSLPWINVFYARVGQVVGTRENFADLLDDFLDVQIVEQAVAGKKQRIALCRIERRADFDVHRG